MDALVYVDPSPRGEWALALAALLPAGLAPRWVLLATEEDLASDPSLLARARARLADDGRPLAESRRPGPAEKAIVEEVLSGAHGLVIVPPAGRNAIQRMLKGSRIATVVKRVRASVLVARRPPTTLRRVLAALSGGPSTASVVAQALGLGRATGAEVSFLHVTSEVTLPFRAPGGGPEKAPPEVGDAAAGSEAAIRAALRDAGASQPLLLREGLVVDEVIAEVENGAHDLLLIGGLGATGWGREDVVERILLHCPASVLVVRSGG